MASLPKAVFRKPVVLPIKALLPNAVLNATFPPPVFHTLVPLSFNRLLPIAPAAVHFVTLLAVPVPVKLPPIREPNEDIEINSVL